MTEIVNAFDPASVGVPVILPVVVLNVSPVVEDNDGLIAQTFVVPYPALTTVTGLNADIGVDSVKV